MEFEEDINKEDLIVVEDMVIIMICVGYVKCINLIVYCEQKCGGWGFLGGKLCEEDVNIGVFVGFMYDYLLFFMDQGCVFYEKIYDLLEVGCDVKGIYICNLLLGLCDDENIVLVLLVSGFDQLGSFIFVIKSGVIKKSLIIDYVNIILVGLIVINL